MFGTQLSSSRMTPSNRARLTKSLATALGFERVGITQAGPSERGAYYKAWLEAGYAGTQEYLKRNVGLRSDPSQLLSGARSIICVAVSYNRAETAPETGGEGEHPRGRVASYARGRDYHVVLRRMLTELMERLRAELNEAFEWRICVDTAPLLERDLARQAGLGWIGKNTCLLDRQVGSYLFLGEALTTLDIEPDSPVTDHCGTCTRCIDACPTGALIAPYQLDARRCISYLTIEHRGEISEEFHAAMGNCVYGCDICQQVCPYNQHARPARQPEILTEHTPAMPDLLELVRMRSGEYRRLTDGSASRRATRNMWRRNAAIALGNVSCADEALRDTIGVALSEAAEDDYLPLRAAAVKSLARLGADRGRFRKKD
jgi:epoxyqueuosine reductase